MVTYDKDKYFSVSDLAKYLGTSHGKVYKILQLPGVPKTRQGRIYLIDKQKFFEWQESYQGEIV